MDHIYKISSGGVWPLNIPVTQSWIDIGAVLTAIRVYEIKTFVEIGVHRGGLASLLMLRAKYDSNFHYFGIDVSPQWFEEKFIKIYADCTSKIIVEDVFSEKGRRFISEAIHNSLGPALLYCDGGNKPKEILEFCQSLRDDDIILVHDYGNEVFDSDLEKVNVKWMHPLKDSWLLESNIRGFRSYM